MWWIAGNPALVGLATSPTAVVGPGPGPGGPAQAVPVDSPFGLAVLAVMMLLVSGLVVRRVS